MYAIEQFGMPTRVLIRMLMAQITAAACIYSMAASLAGSGKYTVMSVSCRVMAAQHRSGFLCLTHTLTACDRCDHM